MPPLPTLTGPQTVRNTAIAHRPGRLEIGNISLVVAILEEE